MRHLSINIKPTEIIGAVLATKLNVPNEWKQGESIIIEGRGAYKALRQSGLKYQTIR